MDVLESKTDTRSERDNGLEAKVRLKQGLWKNAQPAMRAPSVKESRCV